MATFPTIAPVKLQAPAGWTCVTTVEMHTGGEPLRIPVSGMPVMAGSTILERRRDFREKHDKLRTALMFEPRGHADMYGAILCEGTTEGSDFGTFFVHNEGYSTMCGHAIIALTKFAYEMGFVSYDKPSLRIDAPPGLIRSTANFSKENPKIVESTTFLNVPSFAPHRNKTVQVERLGNIKFDVSYGGAFYAIVDVNDPVNAAAFAKIPNFATLSESAYNDYISSGKAIKHAVMAKPDEFPVTHPFEEDLSFLYGVIFVGTAHDAAAHSRNVCIFANGEVDRSPTGSGVSARSALHHARGDIEVGDKPIVIESILGSTMSVRAAEVTEYGPHKAIVPEVTGSAWFCGKNEHWIDPSDPLKDGFIFR